MTVVPPAVAPELGETLVTTGEDGGEMFALKLAEVDWFVESVTFTENGERAGLRGRSGDLSG